MTADTQRLLLPHHVALIKASSITDKVRGERGYWSAMTTADLLPLGFRGQQAQLAPALVEPTYNVRGEQVGCDIRPDHPRLSDEGKPRKYEVPARSTVVIDVPPGARVKLADPAEALWVTEGHRKGDALVSQGLCGIDLAGVWNWRGRSTIGGRTALPCWESIHTKGRVVYICFDSDVMTKAEVHKSLVRLKAFLESRGARVLVIYLPPAGDGSKTGVDDFFFAGHSVEDLIALASRELYQPENLGKPRGQDALIKLGQELLHNVVRAEGGGPAYAIFKSGEVWPVRSSTFKSRLVLGHFQNTGFAPEKEGIEQVLTLTEAESTKAGHAVPVGVRVMGTDERIFVDLADEHGTIITITPERWDVGSGPSLVEQGAIFRRPRGMLSLPVPAPGGSIDDLREFVNLADEQWPLFIADLTSMFRPSGRTRFAKSTASRARPSQHCPRSSSS
jgi:hypothetical protein